MSVTIFSEKELTNTQRLHAKRYYIAAIFGTEKYICNLLQ